MEHYSTSQKMKIGLFLLLGMGVILFSILILGGDRALFKSYKVVYLQLKHVQGLNIGSVVSLSGINIGNIYSIEIADRNQVRLALKIDEQFLKRIHQDAEAELRTQGALGDKYIFINPGVEVATSLKEGDEIKSTTTPDLIDTLAARGSEATKIFDILEEVKILLKTVNANNRTDKIMTNMTEASQSLKLTADEARKLIAELRGPHPEKWNDSMMKLNNILAKIDKGEGTLGALINDPSLHEQLKNLLGGSSRKKYMKSLIQTSIEQGDSK